MGILSSTTKKLTIADLMSAQGQTRLAGAQSCSARLESVTHEIKQESVLDRFKNFLTRTKGVMYTHYVTTKWFVLSGTGGSHYVVIRLEYDPQSVLGPHGNSVQVYCDCPDFMYRSAYNLKQVGALFISEDTDLLLGPAMTTAPKGDKAGTLSVCKHCIAALNELMAEYQIIMR